MPTHALDAETRLLDAFLAREDLMERLEDHHPGTERFRRVLVNETIAGLLCLGDVASMLDLPTAEIVALANGGRPEASGAEEPALTDEPGGDGPHGVRWQLDLRPIFEAGHEPLADVLCLVARAGRNDVVVIDAPFHAKPLRRLLRRRGFASAARAQASHHWRIWFHRRPPHPAAGGAASVG